MVYTIIESFSPEDGEAWENYCAWREMRFDRFDSIDGMLRKNLFGSPKDEDWDHVVLENGKIHLITDLAFARKKHAQIGRGDLVGLKFDDHDIEHPGFRGFDLVDLWLDVSLLTNWGNDLVVINDALAPNALIPRLETLEAIIESLREEWAGEPHYAGCQIVSVYEV